MNTNIGYEKEELKKTSTDDLLILRKAIYSYLKSPNLKKRNPNYLKLFKRLEEEIKTRNISFAQKFEFKIERVFLFFKNFFIFFISLLYFYNFIQKIWNEERKDFKNDLLKKKRKNENLVKLDLKIPEFLQDKEKQKEISLSTILDNKLEKLKSFGIENSGKSKKYIFLNFRKFRIFQSKRIHDRRK